MKPTSRSARIAVLLPCYNEGLSIKKVVADFSKALPESVVYVYDNNSTDNTQEEALQAGAIVRIERWAGKGNVVRRMFSDVEADIYVIADGDGTYDANMARVMIERLQQERLDMVVGTRKNIYSNAYRFSHGVGNLIFNLFYRTLFGPQFSDIFSGYRVFSRRFVKSFPAVSSGFEIETEMSVHASQLKLPIAEIETEYAPRQEGSSSKLRTFRDAFRILATFLILYKEIRPARFFGILSAMLAVAAVLLAFPLFITYLETGLVPRFPTAILATGMMLLAGIFMACGLILDSVARSRLEQKRIWYMNSTHWPERSD